MTQCFAFWTVLALEWLFFPIGKEKLKQIITGARFGRFKNDCGCLCPKVCSHCWVRYASTALVVPAEPWTEEKDMYIKELKALVIISREPNPITNGPIRAVKKPKFAGGDWWPVINFKSLSCQSVANWASLINPQAVLTNFQVKKFKSYIDFTTGFFFFWGWPSSHSISHKGTRISQMCFRWQWWKFWQAWTSLSSTICKSQMTPQRST